MVGMDATTIVLPSVPADAKRPTLPLLAAIVPIIAGIVLWLVTGSLFALCFAALGPLMLVASFLDGLRTRGRDRRRVIADMEAMWQRAESELEELQLQERAGLWNRDPGVAECLLEPPLRGRDAPDRGTSIVLGRGVGNSRVQIRGGDDERSRAFRTRAQHLEDAPVVVPLGGGICIRAAAPVAAAVVRALVVQMCLRFGPTQLGLSGDEAQEWGLDTLPHYRRRRAVFRVGVGEREERVDAMICIRRPGVEPPDGITTVVDCVDPGNARVRTPDGERDVAVEAISAQQARTVGADLAERSGSEMSIPDRIGFDELSPPSLAGLACVIGRGEGGEVTVDLVDDGPHAIVTGMTGTGKSELLTSWVTGLAAVHSPEELAFVLVDFKGGTAFDPLRVLPHVVAVITDLDAEGARRGVGSLSAELRRREAELARVGARDVSECASLSRLVIVVDEFAALLQEHPDLGAIFTDVAARGRALGMHLVLGTQRASGIIRDALAANCPLRISLRVAETADSRFVIGSDAAADLPGGTDSRGLAFIRRPRDSAASAARIALTSAADLAEVQRRWAGRESQRSPWLPALPARLTLPDDTFSSRVRSGEEVILGRADEPERQRQPWVMLGARDALAIVGGPGSGKSSALQMLASQLPDAILIPDDLEQAWDAVAELATGLHGPVLCDDLDVLVGGFPPDYAQLFLSRWERIVRARVTTVITLSRVSGPLGRLIDSLPRRALLRLASRVEHIAAGGDPAAFNRDRPDGRAWMDGREMQLCLSEKSPGGRVRFTCDEAWQPRARRSGIITPAPDAAKSVLTAAHPVHSVVSLTDAVAADPETEGSTRAGESDRQMIVVGDPEQWRAHWALLQAVRTSGELVVAAECASELRQLAGVRELPPYAQLHSGRAWSVRAGRMPRRVLLS